MSDLTDGEPVKESFDDLLMLFLAMENERIYPDPNSQVRLKALRPFSSVLSICELSLERGVAGSLDELKREFERSTVLPLGMDRSINMAVVARAPFCHPATAVELLRRYYLLPEADRELAAERSDELALFRPLAPLHVYELIWKSSLPVSYLDSKDPAVPPFQVSAYEEAFYAQGHHSSSWKTFGKRVPLLLDSVQLDEALRRIAAPDLQSKAWTLRELTRLKPTALTADILLELVRLGYRSEAHVRRAGTVLGTTPRSHRFFDVVISGGPALAIVAL